ncbi:MAG: hypothetical protein Q9195_004791 [Heterodermia aff. obscurata]
MPSTSPYAVAESDPPIWRPGEETAASVFVGISLFLALETSFKIIRLFRKHRGLYFWSMILGTSGCVADCVGIILKYLRPQPNIWPFYTLCLLSGWTVYALAQLLVLYSRLHLVNQSPRVQRFVLIVIVSTVFTCTIPTWVVVWPAYNTDPNVSSLWSPRDAIVERYTQIYYIIVEAIVSGVYIWSLLGLLYMKSSVRQRRVMIDLIYANIVILAFDLLTVILVYLNQLGLSHPIQSFSYIFKLRLEFLVLNQLMSVAARGLHRETFAEKRYHHKSQNDTFSSELRRWGVQDPPPTEQKSESLEPEKHVEAKKVPSRDNFSKGSLQISMPSPTLSRGIPPPASAISERKPSKEGVDLPHFPQDDASSDEASQMPPESPVLPPENSPSNRRRIKTAMASVRPRSRCDPDGSESRPIPGHGEKSTSKGSGTLKTIWRNSLDENDDEEEIGLHMWENRGRVILEVPWFKTSMYDA